MQGQGKFARSARETDIGGLGSRLFSYILPCKVAKANYRAGKVRLVLLEGTEDEFLTEWVPWMTVRAGNTRHWDAPEPGEKGLLFCPSGKTKNGVFLPGHFYSKAELPCDDPDIIKSIYLNEEVGLYEYNRRTGRRRWRIHEGGEFRHEIGIVEKKGDVGTSHVIQTRDMIELRVGRTRLVIKDGLFRVYTVDAQNNEAEINLDSGAFNARVRETGVLKLSAGEASLGVLSAPPNYDSSAQTPPFSGMVADTGGAQLIYNESSVIRLTSGDINLELPGQQSRLSITANAIMQMVKQSVSVVSALTIEHRVTGTSVSLTSAAIVVVSPEAKVSIPGFAPGGTFMPGAYGKFNAANKMAPPETPAPPAVTQQWKPFMPQD